MNKKILVIEDDPSTARMVEYALKHHGYQVITAANGTEGLKKAQNEAPGLVILDVMLPGIDGFELCRRLRGGAGTSGIAILMFSARAQGADRETGLEAGADDYLTKPASHTEIIAKVEKLMSIKNGASPLPQKPPENDSIK